MQKIVYATALLLVVIVLLGNFVFLLNNGGFYSREFSKLGVNETLALNVVSFVNGEGSLGPSFGSREASHLSDVRDLFAGIRRVYYASLAILSVAVAYLVFRRRFNSVMPSSLILSGAISLLLLLLVFVFSLNFSSFFSFIHEPFFAAGTWVFPEGSLLIRLFPEQFFRDFSYNLFRLIFVNSAVFLGIGLFIRKKFKKQESG